MQLFWSTSLLLNRDNEESQYSTNNKFALDFLSFCPSVGFVIAKLQEMDGGFVGHFKQAITRYMKLKVYLGFISWYCTAKQECGSGRKPVDEGIVWIRSDFAGCLAHMGKAVAVGCEP